MDKETYLAQKASNSFTTETFYEMYLDKRDPNKILIPFDLFSQTFPMFYSMSGNPLEITNRLIEHFDNKFK
jgi:hypothetical protein